MSEFVQEKEKRGVIFACEKRCRRVLEIGAIPAARFGRFIYHRGTKRVGSGPGTGMVVWRINNNHTFS